MRLWITCITVGTSLQKFCLRIDIIFTKDQSHLHVNTVDGLLPGFYREFFVVDVVPIVCANQSQCCLAYARPFVRKTENNNLTYHGVLPQWDSKIIWSVCLTISTNEYKGASDKVKSNMFPYCLITVITDLQFFIEPKSCYSGVSEWNFKW